MKANGSEAPVLREDTKRWTRHLHGRKVTVTPCLRFQRKMEGKMILQQLVHDEEAGVSEWVDVPMTVE
jgi:hypothetical protein